MNTQYINKIKIIILKIWTKVSMFIYQKIFNWLIMLTESRISPSLSIYKSSFFSENSIFFRLISFLTFNIFFLLFINSYFLNVYYLSLSFNIFIYYFLLKLIIIILLIHFILGILYIFKKFKFFKNSRNFIFNNIVIRNFKNIKISLILKILITIFISCNLIIIFFLFFYIKYGYDFVKDDELFIIVNILNNYNLKSFEISLDEMLIKRIIYGYFNILNRPFISLLNQKKIFINTFMDINI